MFKTLRATKTLFSYFQRKNAKRLPLEMTHFALLLRYVALLLFSHPYKSNKYCGLGFYSWQRRRKIIILDNFNRSPLANFVNQYSVWNFHFAFPFVCDWIVFNDFWFHQKSDHAVQFEFRTRSGHGRCELFNSIYSSFGTKLLLLEIINKLIIDPRGVLVITSHVNTITRARSIASNEIENKFLTFYRNLLLKLAM